MLMPKYTRLTSVKDRSIIKVQTPPGGIMIWAGGVGTALANHNNT
jgi:hypothetical protein